MSKNIAIVCGSYHKKEIENMLELASDQAEKEGLTISQIVWVPGAMEVPLALNRIVAASGESLVGAACLGIIEKGQTQHGLAMGQALSLIHI